MEPLDPIQFWVLPEMELSLLFPMIVAGSEFFLDLSVYLLSSRFFYSDGDIVNASIRQSVRLSFTLSPSKPLGGNLSNLLHHFPLW